MPIKTFSRSSHFASSTDSPPDNAGVVDCYKPLSVEAEGSALCWREIAANMHCLAMVWSPIISLTWPSDGYFTFWCRVEEIAPRA